METRPLLRRATNACFPAIASGMQSIESLICCGKRLFAARAGLNVRDRAPAMRCSARGENIVARLAADLGALPVHQN